MSDLKENFNIQMETAKLKAAEAGLNFGGYFQSFPAWKRRLLYLMLILLIPAYIAVRYGTEQAFALKYKNQALSAHPSFQTTEAPTVGPVETFYTGSGYSAYVEVQNNNLDLGASGIPYTFTFENSSGQQTATATGIFYLLPNQKKFVVVPRIDTTESVYNGTFTMGEIKWQRKLDLPEVVLKTSEPFVSQTDTGISIEGSVVNDSPYQVGTVRLVYLVRNQYGDVIGASQREEFRVPSFGRRAYVLEWPGLLKDNISRVEVIADTNTLDGNNIVIDETPPSDTRDLQNNSNGF